MVINKKQWWLDGYIAGIRWGFCQQITVWHRIFTGNLGAMTCNDMQWHAKTCNDMQWHAMTCNDMQWPHVTTSPEIARFGLRLAVIIAIAMENRPFMMFHDVPIKAFRPLGIFSLPCLITRRKVVQPDHWPKTKKWYIHQLCLWRWPRAVHIYRWHGKWTFWDSCALYVLSVERSHHSTPLSQNIFYLA